MSTHIKVTTTVIAPGTVEPSALPEESYEILEVPQGVRFVPLDGGATFIAAVIYVFGEFAKGLGEGLGKTIGEKLFSNGTSQGEIKALLDFFTNYILREVRQEFYQDRWNDAHDKLAVAGSSLNNALIDPTRRTQDDLLRISGEMLDGYLKLQRLGPGAYASVTRMGAAMIANDLLYAQLTGKKESYQVALNSLDRVIKDATDTIDGLRNMKDSRVVGPYETEVDGWCSYLTGPEAVVSKPMGIASSPLRIRREVVYVPRPVYSVSIDGAISSFHRKKDICHQNSDVSASALANATATANAARAIIDQEFLDKFQTPFEALKQEAKKVREKIGEKV